MSNLRQVAFDIVGNLSGAKRLSHIYIELKKASLHFGYDTFVLGYLPRSAQQTLQDCATISGWPEEWARRYQANGHIRVDPILRHMRGVIDPFLWQEAVDAAASPAGRVVIDEARAFRLHEGFCVPFHQIDGSEGGISFGGEQVRLSYEARAALHLVAIYALSTVRALVRQPAAPAEKAAGAAALTAREIECLKWSAAGKTAWEISVILSISRRTVEHHLASAGQKLQTVGRVQCVVEALRRGIIT